MLLLRLAYVFYLGNRLLDGQAQVFHVDGLRGKVEGTLVHRFTDVAHIVVGTYHDDPLGWIFLLVNLGQQCQTVHLWHVDVREDNIYVRTLSQQFKRLPTVIGKQEFVFTTADLPSEVLSHQRLHLLLVINT